MFLSDTNIRSILDSLQIGTSNPDRPFDVEKQVQPASIDLRIDRVFWLERKRPKGILDLQASIVDQIDARRYWSRIELNPRGSTIVLKPGELVLARIYERITIPDDYVGLIFCRSSFARMGLSVSCGAEFINPGWSGHMPLQIINHGKAKVRVYPYLPMVQLVLVKLTTKSHAPYGCESLGSKYPDDDGGPSYWWRDESYVGFKSKMESLGLSSLALDQVLKKVGRTDISCMERFERFLSNHRLQDLPDASTLLPKFAAAEERKERTQIACQWIKGIFATAITGNVARLLIWEKLEVTHAYWIMASVALLALYAWDQFYRDQPGPYLTSHRLAQNDDP